MGKNTKTQLAVVENKPKVANWAFDPSDNRIPKRMRDRVCITGFAGSKIQTPFEKSDTFELWGLNELYQEYPLSDQHPWTRWFEVHQDLGERAKIRSRNEVVRQHLPRLSEMAEKIPVYTTRRYPEVPKGKILPYQALMERFGRYFTNSISWEIALAIAMGFEEIWVVGVDMAQAHSEYSQQRPSCEYFLGLARGMGIKVFVPGTSDLLKTTFVYGVDEDQLSPKMDARYEELQRRKAAHEQNEIQLDRQSHQLAGRLEQIAVWLRDTPKDHPDRAKMEQQHKELSQHMNQVRANWQREHDACQQLLGALEDCRYVLQSWANSRLRHDDDEEATESA